MAKINPMLAKIEEKYRREYEEKLAIARAGFLIKLDMALQQSSDAALMALDDVFEVTEEKAEEFQVAHIEYVNKISHMAVVEDKDDPDMWWTKDTVDKRLLGIVGKKRFVPWDDRYTVRKGK